MFVNPNISDILTSVRQPSISCLFANITTGTFFNSSSYKLFDSKISKSIMNNWIIIDCYYTSNMSFNSCFTMSILSLSDESITYITAFVFG